MKAKIKWDFPKRAFISILNKEMATQPGTAAVGSDVCCCLVAGATCLIARLLWYHPPPPPPACLRIVFDRVDVAVG